jgi:hypothetical protein
MESHVRHVKIEHLGRPQSPGLAHSSDSSGLRRSVDALAAEPTETLTFRDLRGTRAQPRLLLPPLKPRFRLKWRWVVAGIVAWFLSVGLAIVAGLWLLFVLNPPGTFHDYRGIAQALFLRLSHDDKFTFYGPIDISARWGNQPYWHQMRVQDLTITTDQLRRAMNEVKPLGRAGQTVAPDHDVIDDRHNQGPQVRLTPK